MSSFVVDDETINKIVSAIFARAAGPDPSINWENTKLYRMGYDPLSSQSCVELAHKMFEMNVTAFNERYGEGEAEKDRPLAFRYQFVPASQIEVIKALKAWKYQCTEGRMPSLRLYQAMVEVHCLLCIDFVEQTEEYEEAPWGGLEQPPKKGDVVTDEEIKEAEEERDALKVELDVLKRAGGEEPQENGGD